MCFLYNIFEGFSHEWILNFVKCFSAVIKITMSFILILPFVNIVYHIDFWILNHCIPGIDPTWSSCITLIMYYWVEFVHSFSVVHFVDVQLLWSFIFLHVSCDLFSISKLIDLDLLLFSMSLTKGLSIFFFIISKNQFLVSLILLLIYF